MKHEFSRQSFEQCSNIKSHEIQAMGAELFQRTDRQTDRHEDNGRFSHCAKAPETSTFCPHAAFTCFVWI